MTIFYYLKIYNLILNSFNLTIILYYFIVKQSVSYYIDHYVKVIVCRSII